MTMIEAIRRIGCMISDKVPPQCDVTGNVQIMTFDSTPEEWAKYTDRVTICREVCRADGAKSVNPRDMTS